MNKYLIYLISILVSACVFFAHRWHKNVEECRRLKANQESLMDDVDFYQTKAHKSAASVLQLQLTHSELERNYKRIVEQAKELDIKVKRLESASQTHANTYLSAYTSVRDSIVYRDVERTVYRDTLKVFAWKDNWMRVDGTLDRDSVSLHVHSTDTIIQLVHRVPKRFLFFRFGCKAIRQEIVSSNPHTSITYSKYIKVN